MKINVTQLPCDEPSFVAALEEYRAAREAASKLEGAPAPFPPYEIMRVIVDRSEPLEIERDELQEKAKAVGRNALEELDTLKARVDQLYAMRPT